MLANASTIMAAGISAIFPAGRTGASQRPANVMTTVAIGMCSM